MFTSLLLSLAAMAQNYGINAYGHVHFIIQNEVIPVPNHPVLITVDSSMTGFYYENTVYTNQEGYYEDFIEIPGYNGYELLHASTYDSCLGYHQTIMQPIIPGVEPGPMDFLLCSVIPPDCQASFYFMQENPADPFTYNFQNISYGNYTEVFWDFGDSTFSQEMNPIHTFPGEGTYQVCLTISGSECNSTYCEYIYIGGGSNDCENYFMYYNADNDPYTFTFEGYLMNGQTADMYYWEFGDGVYAEGQTVPHTYQPVPGGMAIYLVGLTTYSSLPNNDSCYYTSYQEIWIGNGQPCNAYFTYFADSADTYTVYFQDLSFDPNGQAPETWYWEFGDGSTSDLQNPVHTYADSGYYTVCLTITADSGICTSTYCDQVPVGVMPPPAGCESFILPINMYGLTVDFEGYTVSPYETDYTWDFGDGTTGNGQFVSHTYPAAGMYNVYLNTVDATGCTFQTFSQIWVDSTGSGGCYNYFTYEQSDSLTFDFSGFVYLDNGGTYPDSSSTYLWDFGDGTTGTGQFITHSFQPNNSGEYLVCLTTTSILADGSLCTAVYCEPVFIVEPSFSIYGSVILGNNMLADDAIVRLMEMDSLWQGVVEIASVTIDSGGFYVFQDVPMYNGLLYFVQAELTQGSAHFGQYLPTYHLNALTWEQAMPVLPLENWPADIFMIPATQMESGNGKISGLVTELETRGIMHDVVVMLLDEDKNPLMYQRSDEQGQFSFDKLPMGTYIIHAEIMGIHTVQSEITLDELNTEASVEVQVSGSEVNVVYGIGETLLIEKVGEVYPNPVTALSNIDITVAQPVKIDMMLYGQNGQLISTNTYSLDKGSHSIRPGTDNLPAGLYLLRISTSNGESVSRKIVKVQ